MQFDEQFHLKSTSTPMNRLNTKKISTPQQSGTNSPEIITSQVYDTKTETRFMLLSNCPKLNNRNRKRYELSSGGM